MSADTNTAQASAGTPKHCVPCQDLTPLSTDFVKENVAKMPLWNLNDKGWLERTFVAKSFADAMRFINAVGEIAERESHHPDIHITGYRTVTINIYTHTISSISENDFVLASLIDAVPVTYSPRWLKEHPEAIPAAAKTKSAAEVSAQAVEAAQSRIAGHVHRTRVFTCGALDQLASAAAGSKKELFLKAEHEQRVGAFKIRGAINAISLSEAEHIVTQSSGNHAQAVALGCKVLGKKALVVMPKNSPSVKVNAVRDTYGAEVRFCEPTQEAREAMSATIVDALRKEHGEDKAEEVHPNQDIRVINGQGTVALEFLQQQPDLDAIVASIGGGGLIAGIATYAKHVNPAIKIIGAEAAAAKSAYMSKKSGKLVTNPPNTAVVSIADAVKSSLGPNTYPIVDKFVDDVFIVSEQEIEDATKFVMERSKQVIEPACGVAVAVATSKEFHEKYPDLRKIGVVMCGGNLDLDSLPWSA